MSRCEGQENLGPETRCRRGGRSGRLSKDKRESEEHRPKEFQDPLRWTWKAGVGPSVGR